VLVESPLVFPPPEEPSSLLTYRELRSDDEVNAWNEAFGR
jgi:hypothetical protein